MRTDNATASEVTPLGLDRRQLVKAGAWAVPVLAVAVAAPATAATGTTDAGWVAAVRLTAGYQYPPSAPGFRFGHTTSKGSVTVSIKVTLTSPYPAKVNASTLFTTFGGAWSLTDTGSGTFTFTGTLTTGPSTYDAGNTVPGGTQGVTLRGVPGTYVATVVSDGLSGHTTATLTVS